MKSFICALLVSVGVSAWGANGIEAAARLCPDIGFAADVTKCNQLVSGADYFEEAAVNICAGFSFANKKLPCLEAIKNKTYLASFTEACRGLNFDDKIMDCLRSSGKAYVPPAPTTGSATDTSTGESFNRRQIRHALRQLDKGNYGKVREILNDMLMSTK